ELTYNSPLFSLLLWLFFVNILFAALRRAPFKRKHIPFLITHLGLLMILLGCFVKGAFGTQGEMALAEGVESSTLFIPRSYALQIEDREGSALVPLRYGQKGEIDTPFELKVTLLQWLPHAEERYESWVHDGQVHLFGLPPFRRLLSGKCRLLYNEEAPGPSISFFDDHLIAKSESSQRFEAKYSDDAIMIFDKGFRGYGSFVDLPSGFPDIELISPLVRVAEPKSKLKKREDQRALIRLLVEEGERSEVISLVYDPRAQRLKWPILFGRYLVRFVANQKQLPHKVLLHQARQINYLGTAKPLAFESDLELDGSEKTISMNRVAQSKKGYRFYMSNLYTPSQNSAARALIVVNKDPGKRFLTYPGGVILALGIVLLFWQRRYA
nr:hypothetical protein [Chlamydiota bacterium]